MTNLRSAPIRRVAGVWLVRDSRILLLQRAGGQSDGAWVPPGGNVDPNEDPLAAAIRETLEETGLMLTNPEFLRSWIWDGPERIAVYHFVGFAQGPMVQISNEHYDFDWLTPSEYAARHLLESRSGRFEQWTAEMRVSATLAQEWVTNASGPTGAGSL